MENYTPVLNSVFGLITAGGVVLAVNRLSQILLRRKDEPRLYPYWIPWFGHAQQIVFNGEGLYNAARAYFGSSAPFALHVAGQTVYVVSDPEDVKAAMRNTKTLAWEINVHEILLKVFAMTRAGADTALNYDVPGKGKLLYQSGAFYRHHLMQTDELNFIATRVVDEISQALDNELSRGPGAYNVELWDWSRRVMFSAVTRAILGPHVLERYPRLFEDYSDFDEGFHMLAYQYPDYATKSVRAARERFIASITDFMSDYERLQVEAMPIICRRHDDALESNISVEDSARLQASVFWALHTNSVKVSFYILMYLLAAPSSVLNSVRAEVDAAFTPGSDLPSLDVLVKGSPHLNAAINETLRLVTSSNSVRLVAADTPLAGLKLRVGARVLMPSLHLHRSKEIWGSNPNAFDPERPRWAEGESVAHVQGIWRPFGGGHTYCPGRLLARREICTFVALLLRRFKNLRVVGEHPGPDLQRVSLGVMDPAPGVEKVRLAFEI